MVHGSVYSINDEAYHIAMLMIFWITKAVGHALVKYSEAGGARGEYTETMLMKNEFLYPVMTQADVKKPVIDTDSIGTVIAGHTVSRRYTIVAFHDYLKT